MREKSQLWKVWGKCCNLHKLVAAFSLPNVDQIGVFPRAVSLARWIGGTLQRGTGSPCWPRSDSCTATGVWLLWPHGTSLGNPSSQYECQNSAGTVSLRIHIARRRQWRRCGILNDCQSLKFTFWGSYGTDTISGLFKSCNSWKFWKETQRNFFKICLDVVPPRVCLQVLAFEEPPPWLSRWPH